MTTFSSAMSELSLTLSKEAGNDKFSGFADHVDADNEMEKGIGEKFMLHKSKSVDDLTCFCSEPSEEPVPKAKREHRLSKVELLLDALNFHYSAIIHTTELRENPRKGKFTVFVITVTAKFQEKQCTWTVGRRFNEFLALHQKLTSTYGSIKSRLPSKNFFSNNFSTDFIESRRKALNMYLSNILQEVKQNQTLIRFIGVDNAPFSFLFSLQETHLPKRILDLRKKKVDVQQKIFLQTQKLQLLESSTVMNSGDVDAFQQVENGNLGKPLSTKSLPTSSPPRHLKFPSTITKHQRSQNKDNINDEYDYLFKSIEQLKKELHQLFLEGDEFMIEMNDHIHKLQIQKNGCICLFPWTPSNSKLWTLTSELDEDKDHQAIESLISKSLKSNRQNSKIHNQNGGGFQIQEGLEGLQCFNVFDIQRTIECQNTFSSNALEEVQVVLVDPSRYGIDIPTANLAHSHSSSKVDSKGVTESEEERNVLDLFLQDRKELLAVLWAHMHQMNVIRKKVIKRLSFLDDQTRVKYDSSNEIHEKELIHLWDALYPETPLTGRFSNQWTLIGFQGNDPATDFRGMGILGLHNCLYIAKKYQKEVLEIFSRNNNNNNNQQQKQQQQHEYPFCCGCISMTNYLITKKIRTEILKLHERGEHVHSPLFRLFCVDYQEDFFERLFVITMFLLDKYFVESHASYMDFPRIFEKTTKIMDMKLISAAISNDASLNSFVEWMRMLGISH